jgi:hypothetical protein
MWNISVRTGLEAGKVLTEDIYFPKGEPSAASSPQAVVVPSTSDLQYTHESEENLAAGLRVFPFSGVYPTTAAVSEMAFNETAVPQQELALAFNVPVLHEFRKMRGQIGTLFMDGGSPTGYQLLSFSPKSSIAPFIISDNSHHLYLTWLEHGEENGYKVYFASTAPDILQALSTVTWGDLTRINRDIAFGLLSGIALAPILVSLWSLIPIIVLYLTSILRRGRPGKRIMVATIISVLLAGAAYWAIKLTTIPGIRSYVPFSAWIPGIPMWLQAPLQIGVPILTTLTGIAVAWYFTYRRNSDSILNYILLFAAVDGLLTMAVYGFQFFNVI